MMDGDYINDSLTLGLMGVPVGMLLGYAIARVEDLLHHHHRKGPRDHS